MKKIKNWLLGIMMLAAVIGLCACGKNSNESNNQSTEATADNNATQADNGNNDEETLAEADGKVHYVVKVVDEAGNPIEGAMVQLCNESCYPSKTNEEGVAEFNLEENDYKVSFMMLPEGYAYSGEETEFHFDSGSVELTIVLKAES